MTFQEEISALNDRIAKVESDRDTWRAAGQQEKYLKAFFLLEALEARRIVDTLSVNAPVDRNETTALSRRDCRCSRSLMAQRGAIALSGAYLAQGSMRTPYLAAERMAARAAAKLPVTSDGSTHSSPTR